MDWVDLAHDKGRYRALLNTVIYFRAPKIFG
jgi:hypothetical protein